MKPYKDIKQLDESMLKNITGGCNATFRTKNGKVIAELEVPCFEPLSGRAKGLLKAADAEGLQAEINC